MPASVDVCGRDVTARRGSLSTDSVISAANVLPGIPGTSLQETAVMVIAPQLAFGFGFAREVSTRRRHPSSPCLCQQSQW
jgi:hypothetical protein